jgi:ParB family chromosome partitioning protein
MTPKKPQADKGTNGHGAGRRGGEMFKFSPYDYVIIGLDTNDGPEHHLYDERIKLPVPEERVRNIQTYGVLKPVLFERDGDRQLVVDGRQRIRAARIAWDRQHAAGEVEIEVRGVPVRGDEAHLFGVSRAANVHQVDSPMVDARNAQRRLDLGMSKDAAATATGVTLQVLEQRLLLLGLAPDVRKAVESGAIGVTSAVVLGKLSKAEQSVRLKELTASGVKPTVADTNNRVREARGQQPTINARTRINMISEALAKIDTATSSKDVLIATLTKIGKIAHG